MPKNDSQNATLLGGFDFLKKLGLGRVKKIDPVDSDLQPVQKGQVIGTVSKDRSDEVEKTVVSIPYSSVLSSAAAVRRDGTPVTSRYGQEMSRIVIRLPRKMELDGYSMDGLRVEIVNPDKYLERAEKTGILQASFNNSRPLKLSGFKDGRAIELTVGQDRIGDFVENLGKCCEDLINITTSADAKTSPRDAHVPAISASRKPEKPTAAGASEPRRADEKKPADLGKMPFDGQYLGTKNIDRDVTFDNPKVVIPYGNVIDSECMTDKDGKTKTNKFGQVLNSVTVSVPNGVKVDGYRLGGFTAKVVVVDKYLDQAADEGSLQIMLNGRYDLKLAREDGDRKIYVTIGRDKIGEFAKSLREKSDNILDNDEKNNEKDKKEESLDEMMGGKSEEATLMAANAAARVASDRESADR
ncbi:hypothetical protein [Collinsella sp. AF38-3AC]|uniref:hypothetical protein n=1 Tax=Collinsella sp. AF38-3AC TaxID=2292015 RepID=UPI000E556CCF|nr:hypothetical protein [Collinsella sp. AF38-3AC]RHL22612.1 hypothetical protein DW029_08155 [Collinsella sp. AF38-3AC]